MARGRQGNGQARSDRSGWARSSFLTLGVDAHLMIRFPHQLEELVHRVFAMCARSLEAVEYAFQRMLSRLLNFRRGAEDGEAPFRGGWSDFFETRFDRFIAALTRLLPWHWGRKHEEEPGSRQGMSGADSLETGFNKLVTRVLPAAIHEEQTTDLDEPKSFFARGIAAMRRSEFFLTVALAEAADFTGEWWYSRDWKKLAFATPAIVLCIPLLALIVLVPLYSEDNKILHYQTALLKATQSNDDALEQLYLKKLMNLGYQRQDRADFRRAMSVAGDGKFEQAYEILKQIAPLEEPGFLFGHLWIASALLEGHIDEDRRWQVLETHTLHAKSLNEYHPLVQQLMIEVHLHKGDRASANRLMETNVAEMPSYHATLMHHYHQAGNRILAKKHALRAIDYFERKADPELTPLGHLRWAEAHGVLEDTDQQRRKLLESLKRFPRDEGLRNALAAFSKQQLINTSIDSEAIVDIFARILQADPEHEASWQLILDSFKIDVARAEEVLEQLKQQTSFPASFYKRLGDVYFQQKLHAKATESYTTATRLDPEAAVAWNNLAWLLGNIEPTNLRAAMAAVNHAIATREEPRFFETRGQLWIKLENWEAAIADLERAINGRIPDLSAVHRSLATAYDRTGRQELAEAHRSLASRPEP